MLRGLGIGIMLGAQFTHWSRLTDFMFMLGGGAVLEPQGNVDPVAFADDVADPAVPPAEARDVPDLVATDARRGLDRPAVLEPRRAPAPNRARQALSVAGASAPI
jgi:hypothetical protein